MALPVIDETLMQGMY